MDEDSVIKDLANIGILVSAHSTNHMPNNNEEHNDLAHMKKVSSELSSNSLQQLKVSRKKYGVLLSLDAYHLMRVT